VVIADVGNEPPHLELGIVRHDICSWINIGE
jgi:hypothetical protein